MTPIFPPGIPKPIAPYSPGVLADGILYVSGTLAMDENRNVLHVGDAEAQTRVVLDTITKVVEAAGGTMADVVSNQLFIKDWADFPEVNKAYTDYFPGDKPARYCVACVLVKPDCLIEIATTAHIGKK